MTWSRNGLLAGCAALSIVACSAPANPSDGAILEFDVDRKTNIVERIILGMPSRFFKRGRPMFSVKTQRGDVTAWRASQVALDGNAAAVTLSSNETIGRPRVNDAAIVSFIDSVTDSQHVLPYEIVPPGPTPQPIANGTFVLWTSGMVRSPVAWTKTVSAASFFMEPIFETTSGVRMSVAPSERYPIRVQSLSLDQAVHLTGFKLKIRLRPFEDCLIGSVRQGSKIRAVAGVSITKTTGQHAIFCLTSRSQRFVSRLPSGTIVIAMPGRIGYWNDVTIDIRSAWPNLSTRRPADLFLTVQAIVEIASAGSGFPWATLDIDSIAAAP